MAERQAAARDRITIDDIEARLVLAHADHEDLESRKIPSRPNMSQEDLQEFGDKSSNNRDRDMLDSRGLERPETKREGEEIWRREVSDRFMQGKDFDFDYAEVDDNEEWDDLKEQDRQEDERYFDEVTPEWSVENTQNGKLEGETGFQDF